MISALFLFDFYIERGVIMSCEEAERAILVGIARSGSEIKECEISLNELSRLADTAGSVASARIIQVKDSYDPRTLIGRGKVCELKELVISENASLIIFDEELSPSQIRNLENDIGGVTVIDRNMLILDIFALHARTAEGKIQVELAQLKYTAPRLIGKGSELSRQGGGIGTRGPGESKLETDRRHIREKLVALEAKLREIESTRAVMRTQRDKSHLPKIALVGYTNAGKSTLLNAVTGSDVFAQDKLFATLDPTTRKMTLPSGEQVLITDTVGFIRKLPHQLVKAFKSTLDEVRYADVLILVADISDPELYEHIRVAEDVIEELGAADKPVIYAYNKCDICNSAEAININKDGVVLSSKSKEGIDALLATLEDVLRRSKRDVVLSVPYTEQSVVSAIYSEYAIKSIEYNDDGILICAVLDMRGRGLYKKYTVERECDFESVYNR